MFSFAKWPGRPQHIWSLLYLGENAARFTFVREASWEKVEWVHWGKHNLSSRTVGWSKWWKDLCKRKKKAKEAKATCSRKLPWCHLSLLSAQLKALRNNFWKFVDSSVLLAPYCYFPCGAIVASKVRDMMAKPASTLWSSHNYWTGTAIVSLYKAWFCNNFRHWRWEACWSSGSRRRKKWILVFEWSGISFSPMVRDALVEINPYGRVFLSFCWHQHHFQLK